MELKITTPKWFAGLPVAMIDKKTAEELGVHSKDRITIQTLSKKSKKFSAIVDILDGMLKKNTLGVSAELKERLKLKSGQRVKIYFAESSPSIVYIKKKLDGESLSQKEIDTIIEDVVNNSLSEPEIALFVSAMYQRGMTINETIFLINSISKTGERLSFPDKFVVDKHSIGGIPGNRTTPIVVAICAANGLVMPKTSSRAITTAAGTADVMETICNVDFSIKELHSIVKKTGACLAWGGGLGMVPADSKIISVEKMLNIDPEAQLLASIMAKKIAVGSKYILIDIPYGKTAKVSRQKGVILKEKFEKLGRAFKKKMRVVLTKADEPTGNGVGPLLELIDVIQVLDPKEEGPQLLTQKSLFLAGELLEMTGKAKRGMGIQLACQTINSGEALEKFIEIIEAQGGSIKKLHPAKFRKEILATKTGVVYDMNNKKINSLARVTGCPVDKTAGILLHIHLKSRVKKGEKIMTLYSMSKARLNESVKFCRKVKPIKIK